MYAFYLGFPIPLIARGKTTLPTLSTLESRVPATKQLLGRTGNTHYKSSKISTSVASCSWAHLTRTLPKV